jgi:hypothetical protein
MWLFIYNISLNSVGCMQACDEFQRMRQSIVRYAPHCLAYDRDCYEYLVSKMASAAIQHYTTTRRLTAAKGVLGSLPLTSYEYSAFFNLPYG